MDDDLRNSLWNVLTALVWDQYHIEDPEYGRYVQGSSLQSLAWAIWAHFFKKPIDEIPQYWDKCLEYLRNFFFDAEWSEVYDFIEFIVDSNRGEEGTGKLSSTFNSMLERENSAYRFVDSTITEITSATEIESVEFAIAKSEPFAGVKTHLESALALLSNRTAPDYRNSIKESISAVESLARKFGSDKSATLTSVLKELEKNHKLHAGLKNAFNSLYGYTSDADGIRHALMDESNLKKSDARFMLVCCSAFVNYVVDLMGATPKTVP